MRNCCLCHRPLAGTFWLMQLGYKTTDIDIIVDDEEEAEFACKECVELAEKLINKENGK